MKRIRYSEEQIVDALKRVEGGIAVKDLCREFGITEQTYYTWRRKYGGMEKTQVMELKQLRDENNRLKKLVADQALKAINGKNW